MPSSAPAPRRLQAFGFAPVATPCGLFTLSVQYQPANRVTVLEQTTIPGALPAMIPDYAGGGREAGSPGGEGQSARASCVLPQLPHLRWGLRLRLRRGR